MPKQPDRKPINAHSSDASAQARIAAFQGELANAGKPHVLCDDGKIRAKSADLAKPADRPPISHATTVLKKITDETQRQVDAATGKTRPPAPTPPARARAKTPAPPPPARPAPSKHRPAATSTTRTVSAVSFESLADALGITKPQLGELMASDIVPREQFCTPDGAIYWEASAVPAIIEAVVKHRASKAAATAAAAKPVPRPAAAPARPKVTFGPLMTDLPNMCRQLRVSAEQLRTLIAASVIPRGTPANSGNSEIYWPAADFKNISAAVKRHLAAAGK